MTQETNCFLIFLFCFVFQVLNLRFHKELCSSHLLQESGPVQLSHYSINQKTIHSSPALGLTVFLPSGPHRPRTLASELFQVLIFYLQTLCWDNTKLLATTVLFFSVPSLLFTIPWCPSQGLISNLIGNQFCLQHLFYNTYLHLYHSFRAWRPE